MGNKINEDKDLMVEINIAEAPLFAFTRNSKTQTVKSLLENSETTEIAKEILEGIYINNASSKIGYRRWVDSKGVLRELIISSERGLPDAYCMDVFVGLIKLLVKNNAPLIEDENGKYKFKSNKIDFTISELCREMEVKAGGNTYKKIKEALRKLKVTNYYSVGNGSIYDKSKKAYETRSERAISLIESYDTSEILTNDEGEVSLVRGNVIFGSLILQNLIEGFVRVVRNHQYFQLKTGITRGLYLYLESNKKGSTVYAKRSFEVLKNKIPVDFKYPSELKSKINKSLEEMRRIGVLRDWFYGDEIHVNGFKEMCIYFIFKGTRSSLIKELESKVKSGITKKELENEILQEEYNLEFPKNIKEELIKLGVNEQKIQELMLQNTKYELAKYILWIKDGLLKKKVENAAALLVFAMTPSLEGNGKMVKVEKTHPHIIEFIDSYRKKAERDKIIDALTIKKAYQEYLEENILDFEVNEEFVYEAMKETIITEIESVKEKKVKGQKKLYNMARTTHEKEKIMRIIEKWEEFDIKKENSELYKELLVQRVCLYKGLKDYEEFKNCYIEQNR